MVRQMVRLVDDLFDLSRIMQGKLELCKKRVELAAVIADAVETARPVIGAKGHELTLSLPSVPVVIGWGPMRLSQVLERRAGPGQRVPRQATGAGVERGTATERQAGIRPRRSAPDAASSWVASFTRGCD